MATSVQVKNVTKRYGKFFANNNISLTINEGEFVSLLGPSGCGKTTLLSLILGIADVTSGDIYFNEQKIDDIPIHKRDVGMVFQNYALFPHMNVFDNIAFGLKMRKISKSEIKTRVEQALNSVQLEDLGKRFPNTLSGGQQQRVAFARAIVVNPKVLLLDEPLSNLDAKLREEMRFELKKLHKRLGITTIYVTHDQVEALSLSTRIAVMKDGLIQQYGTPLEIFLDPANTFVAGFVGFANFLMGTIIERQDNLILFKDSRYGYQLKIDISEHKEIDSFNLGDTVTITIKPENIQLLHGIEDARGENIFHCKVNVSDYTGSVTRYELNTEQGYTIQVSEIGYSEYQSGTEILAVFPTEKISLIKGGN